MEAISWTMIYWFTSLGLISGLIFRLVVREEGMSLKGNLVGGILGANIMGIIGIVMGIGDGLFFSFLANIPFLFLINVFHQHHQEDLKEEPNPEAHVI